jgi:shikimate 5-dehydrogenase/shikimate kinase/3-dehydroquinate dehydratase
MEARVESRQASEVRSAPHSPSAQPRNVLSATASPRPGVSNALSPKNGHSHHITKGQMPPQRLQNAPTSDPFVGGRQFHPDASVVLVGIRASGKRSLGLIAAAALGWRFVTEDHYFQSVNGLSRQDYLKVYGSEQFHRQDIETSKQMLDENRYQCVIDCGLGSLTSGLQDYLKHYSQTNPVVFVARDMAQISRILNLESRAAKLLEGGNSTHRKCSNYEFYNLEDESSTNVAETETSDRASPVYSFKLRNAQADFSSFVRFITGKQATDMTLQSPFSLNSSVESRPFAHALHITLSDFVQKRVDFGALEGAGDLLEVYVDQLYPNAVATLGELVAMARRKLGVPVLLSANRALAHGTAGDKYMAVLEQGLRLGLEYLSIDLDLEFEVAQTDSLTLSRGHTKLIGTYIHSNSDGRGWRHPTIMDMYKRATTLKLDIVRLLNVAKSREDNQTATWFREEIGEIDASRIPCVAYNIGPLGRTSQMMNSLLTSVTHHTIQNDSSGKEQSLRPALTSREIMAALFESFVFDPLQFCIVGANVSASLSPAMHNAAYQLLGLKHQYNTKNITSWADVEGLAKDDTLGGLSVVQPYKVQLVPHMHALSGHAKAIGAINTLIPLRETSSHPASDLNTQARCRNRAGRIIGWFGENTDFVGIANCVKRSLSPRNVIQPKTTCLVIGAGGMARAAVYAMLQLGCKHIFVYNRTLAHTEAVARHFNDLVRKQTSGTATPRSYETVKIIQQRSDPWPADFAPPTIVISCVSHEVLDGNPGADFQMPDSWMQSPSGGVVVEMAYMTRETPLIKQMKAFRDRTYTPWVLVNGIETLIEQALGQFEAMTGRKAPKRCMTDAVRTAISQQTSYLVDAEEFFT